MGGRESGIQEHDDSLWEWSVFWQSDQLQSCMPANERDASDKLLSTWRVFFEGLPKEARILDLGTGNGSLAVQAVAVSKTKSAQFSIHGVDRAAIEPERFVTSAADLLPEIHFHPRTPMEKLPFADNHFSAVTSQYAIEYSQTDASLPEALRVLQPGAPFRFLLHSDDGVLKERCQLQCRQAEAILHSGLFDVLADLLKKLVKAETQRSSDNTTAAMDAITALKDELDTLEQGFADDADLSLVENLFAAVRSLPDMRRSHPLGTLLDMSDDIRDLLVAQSKRLLAMQRAALDESMVNTLADQLRALGAEKVTLERAVAGKKAHCVGFWLYGRKSPT